MPVLNGFLFEPLGVPTPTVPISMSSRWSVAISAGGMIVVDPLNANSGVIQDGALITNASRKFFFRRNSQTGVMGGTTLRVRMGYAASDAAQMVFPVVRLFAGTGDPTAGDPFRLWAIRNLLGDASVVLPVDLDRDTLVQGYSAAGVPTGNYRFTMPDANAQSFDCDGYDYFGFGVERAYAQSGPGSSTPSQAFLEFKIV